MSNEVKGIIIKDEERQRYYYDYGETPVKVMVRVATYAMNGCLAMMLEAVEETESVGIGEEFYLTVNLREPAPAPNMAYIDVNNMGDKAAAFLEKYGFARNTGKTKKSGFVTYPLYEFDLQKLRRLRRENEAFLSDEDCAIDTIDQFCHAVCEKLNEKQGSEHSFQVVVYECDCGLNHFISMEVEGWKITPKAEIRPLWEKYDYIGEMDSIVDQIFQGFMDFKEELDKEEPWDIEDTEAIKKHIGFRMISSKCLPEDAAHVSFLDMEVIFDVHIVPGMGIHAGVTEENLKDWGLNPKEAFELAKKNMARMLPAYVISLDKWISPLPWGAYPLMSQEGAEVLKQKEMEFVLQNETGMHGAGTIFYPGIAKYMAEQLQGNFYILMPVANNVLIVPDKTKSEEEIEKLKTLYEMFNHTDVPKEARLTQTLYYYDAEKDEIFAVE